MEEIQCYTDLIKHLVLILDTEDTEELKKLNYTLVKDKGYTIQPDQDIDVYEYTYLATSTPVHKFNNVDYACIGCEDELKKYNIAILNWLVVWQGYTLDLESVQQVLQHLIEEEQLLSYVTVSREELIELWTTRVLTLGALIADQLFKEHIQKYPTEDIIPLYLHPVDLGIVCIYTTNHLLERCNNN